MTSEEAIQVADQVILAHTGSSLTDIQRMILRESLAGKGYERMEGYAPQHIKNEGKRLWDSLSEALGEKVGKTSFRGALERRLKSGNIMPTPPMPSTYDGQTWVGRESLVTELLPKLQGQTRLLWITGISGIGKTTLGECLVSKAWERDPTFQWIYLEILEGQSPDFPSVAADLLAKLGEPDLDPKERNNPDQLAKRLLQKLQSNPYWIQLDALERLLNPEQTTELVDPYWVTFLQRCLTDAPFASRLVLTSQAFPNALIEFGDRYPNAWREIRLDGLLQVEQQLEFFAKRGISVESANQDILARIAKIYEGHPLVLKVIAEDILKDFAGGVVRYWQVYQPEFEQVARELQAARLDETEYSEALDRKVRERIKTSLKQLPPDALDLLCRSSVFRRPVPKKFWLAMIGDRSLKQQKLAYQVLSDRALIEKEGTDIRQHNLIRDIAYDLLREDTSTWEAIERRAAELWLTAYEPDPDIPNLEKVRGKLEAFEHYCELEDWQAAKTILLDQGIGLQLQTWGHCQEMIRLHRRLLGHLQDVDQVASTRGLGNACFLLSQYPQATSFYQQSLELAREIGDLQRQGHALNNLSNIYQVLGNYPKAIEMLQQALAIAREIADRHGEGNALGNLGNAYHALGEYQRAINFYHQRLAIAREIGDQQGEGNALNNLGNAYHALGEYQRAINFYHQRLAIAREIGDQQGEGSALGNLGATYYSLGKYQRSIEFHQQHLVIAREIGDRQGEGNALNGLGNNYDALGKYQQSIYLYQQRLTIAREIGNRQGEGNALNGLGVTYHALGKHHQAIEFHQQHLVIAREIGDRQGEATALGNLGDTYCNLGNNSKAIELRNQGLAIAKEIGDQSTESHALCGLGKVLIKIERYTEALEALQNALEICNQTGNRSLRVEILKNLAELYQQTGETDRALEYCDRSLELAIELGIPLVKECEELKQQLEDEQNGKEH
jgi:tetratricopeptide (TPR) repeat protein